MAHYRTETLRTDLEAILAMPMPPSAMAMGMHPRGASAGIGRRARAGLIAGIIAMTLGASLLIVRTHRASLPGLAEQAPPRRAPVSLPRPAPTSPGPAAQGPPLSTIAPAVTPPHLATPDIHAAGDVAVRRAPARPPVASPRLAKRAPSDSVDPRSTAATLLEALAERRPAAGIAAPPQRDRAAPADTAVADPAAASASAAPARSSATPLQKSAAVDRTAMAKARADADRADLRRRQALDLIRSLRRQ